mgnify:FL=1
MEGVLFVLGIEETIKQIYNRDKYLKMELDMVPGYSWMKGESYGQKVRFAKS